MTPNCPKCNREMDEGRVSAGEELRYVSNRQKGVLRATTPVRQTRACLTCGYIELYLDAAELHEMMDQARARK